MIETEISRKWNESEICENRLKWNESEIKTWNLSESEMKLKFRSHESEIREKYNFYKFILFYWGIIGRQVLINVQIIKNLNQIIFILLVLNLYQRLKFSFFHSNFKSWN